MNRKQRKPSDWVVSIATLAIVLVLSLLSIRSAPYPDAATADADLSSFSSARALDYVRAIAKEPHPVGSRAHDQARDYICAELVRLGLTPEIQNTTAVTGRLGTPFIAATVQNIVARLKGADNIKAVVLMGHYDSVPTGPGASDNAHSVAVLLETLRALRKSPPLKNDVIFLITDGEELDLLGAEAYMSEHPWAKETGLVLNFEARGNSGPAVMFETGPQNGQLIEEFAKAAPYPLASSLSSAVYEIMPNDTDFTVFKEAGYAGLNFAYIEGLTHYHTQLDTVERLDPRSLQHQGSYALALVRHFGNMDLTDIRRTDEVYFNLPSTTVLVHYPFSWVEPLALAASLFFLMIVILGFRRKLLSFHGILLGIGAFLAGMVAGVVVAYLFWRLARALGDVGKMSYAAAFYLVTFTALTASLFSTLYNWFRRKITLENLAAGAMVFWLILAIISSRYLAGGSYLFLWPLISSAAGFGIWLLFGGSNTSSKTAFVGILAGAVPVLLIFVPMIFLLYQAMTLSLAPALVALVVLILGLLIPHLALIAKPSAWLVPVGAALVAMISFIAGAVGVEFDSEHPKHDSMFYVMDADAGSAFWASADRSPDEWTTPFLTSAPETTDLRSLFPLGPRMFLKHPAPSMPLSAPTLEVLEDRSAADLRTVRLRVGSARGAPTLSVSVVSDAQVLRASVNGKILDAESWAARRKAAQKRMLASRFLQRTWDLFYCGAPNEGIEVSVDVRPGQTLEIRVSDQSLGLPEIPGLSFKPRPGFVIPVPNLPDSTLVTRSFTLGRSS